MDEQHVITLCQGGDELAFRQLVEAYNKPAYRVAYRIVGDTGIAEDATQDAFLAAWRGINTFENGRPFAPWLMKIVVRQALQRLRRNPVRIISMDDPGCSEPIDTRARPDKVVEKEELNEIIGHAIGKLSDQRKKIFGLYYDADLKISDIAELLGLPEGTVKSEMHRGKQDLAKALKGIV